MTKPASFILRVTSPEGVCDSRWCLENQVWRCQYASPPLEWMLGRHARWVKEELLRMGVAYVVLPGKVAAGNAVGSVINALEQRDPIFVSMLRDIIESFGEDVEITLYEEEIKETT